MSTTTSESTSSDEELLTKQSLSDLKQTKFGLSNKFILPSLEQLNKQEVNKELMKSRISEKTKNIEKKKNHLEIELEIEMKEQKKKEKMKKKEMYEVDDKNNMVCFYLFIIFIVSK